MADQQQLEGSVQVLQQIIDGATKSGLFQKAQDAIVAQNALNTIVLFIQETIAFKKDTPKEQVKENKK